MIILLTEYMNGYAQNPILITGVIKDSTGTGLSKATIQLFTGADSVKVLSRDDGSFSLNIKDTRSFQLRVSMRGFQSFVNTYQTTPEMHKLHLPSILLASDYKELESVTVSQTRQVKIKQDTIEYFASAFSVRPGDELDILLKKFSGLHVLADGSVIFQGKKVAKIMINGRDFAGRDMATAIRNLPADIVESIQLIDDYGDKGRLTGVKSGKAEKTLNVILKQDKRNGQFERGMAGAGNKGRYNGTLFTYDIKKDRQLTLNVWLSDTVPSGNDHEKAVYFGYSDRWGKKWSGNGGLGVWGDNHSHSSSTTQNNFYPGNKTQQQQSDSVFGNSRNAALAYTLEYKPDLNTRLRVTPALYLWNSSETTSSDLLSNESDSNFSKITTARFSNLRKEYRLSGKMDVYFERSYPISGQRLSFTGGIHFTHHQQDGDQQSNTHIHTNAQDYISRQHYLPHTKDFTKELITSLNYYLPMGKSAFLELGCSGDYSFTQNDRVTQMPDIIATRPITIDSLSNDYSFNVIIHRLHAGYSAHSKKLNMSLGLDAQPTSQNGQSVSKSPALNYHYFKVLPSVEISYSFSPARRLNLDYKCNTQIPTILQLQPVTDFSNPQYPVTGNPLLRPSFTQTLSLNYEQSSSRLEKYPSFGGELMYAFNQDMIIPNLSLPHDTSAVIQRTSYTNASGLYLFNASYHLELPTLFHKHFRISTSGSISGNQSAIMKDSVLYRTNNWGWQQGLTFSFDLPNVILSELSGSYVQNRVQYSSNEGTSFSAASAGWSFNSYYYLLRRWVLSCVLYQYYTDGGGGSWQTNPAMLNASFERDFFQKNQLKVRFSAYDLFNSSKGISQLVMANSITQNKANLIGRYFLFSVILKLEKFR